MMRVEPHASPWMMGARREGLFWGLQIAGWTAYAAFSGSVFMLTMPDRLFVGLKGIALTVCLRAVYRHMASLRRNLLALALTIACTSLAMAQVCIWLSTWAGAETSLFSPPAVAWIRSPQGLLHMWLLYLAWSGLYFGITHALDLEREAHRLHHALEEAHAARARMLRYQLNPHFLFNSLTALRSLTVEDPAAAGRFTTVLAEFLRETLDRDQPASTTLARELESAGRYLEIEKVRFEDRLEVAIEVDPGVRSVILPALLLQPLVENAVKFGIRSSPRPLRVRLTAARRGERLVIEVANTGRLLLDAAEPDIRPGGIGLANFRDRLEEHFPGRHRFELREQDGWVTAHIELAPIDLAPIDQEGPVAARLDEKTA